MKIGIIGSGVVGKALAAGFSKYRYEVMAESREPGKLVEWKTEISGNLKIGTFGETAVFGEIIVLATKGTVAENAVKLAGIHNLTNKTVIDATNPIANTEPVNGVLKFFTNFDGSLMEQLQVQAPEANFVKVFSCVGSHFMVDPDFESKPTMFIC